MKTIKAKKVSSWLKKMRGLICEKKPASLFFITRFGIHTFGMRFPIDIIIMDEDHRVVKIGKHIRPGNLYFWNPKYRFVLELPDGETDRLKIETGEKIYLTYI